MHNVVIDTNVIISAAITSSGNSAKIVNLALDKTIQLYYSTRIIDEYEEVLSRTEFCFCPEKINTFLFGIEKNGILIFPPISDIPLKDESDRVFYDTAKESRSILISGNTKHFPDESFIMTPSEFIVLLNTYGT